MKFDQNTLLTGAAVVLSLAGFVIPKFKAWLQGLAPEKQFGFMAGIVILLGAAGFGLSCAGILQPLVGVEPVPCSQDGVILVLRAIFFAVMSNQFTYGLGNAIVKGREQRAAAQ